MESKRFTLNEIDFKNAVNNALWFTAPVILIYLTSILGLIQQDGYTFSLEAFIPNNTTIIAMVVWMLNRIVDLIRRFISGK